ncbi:glycerol dehydrogenase [Photobacterium carnosum]|uniref:Glycerol dehydrogenase n=1 Tax=Photobacterium carnosum TaxID=2023717 RepID=A0A2N4UTY0_9GAMM|nr:glycerol dehydrogenase [Photobacterium carnosum]KAE8177020.1 glycerol dehydrogenase [Photobacterium carnosum]MBY3788167.1 glycerol dehydrogenase [Photobacterium carnosum]MCD9494528.1 iron-containing alcohol dehydrogenase [Photobacterium carnosum]MCD9514159.1 iron-containing alcohol dehydrogenase [Photobacterium carnosum]MCD9522103.1 iron-containing alcohol dehydrogenase [Photobacterium carnosum]
MIPRSITSPKKFIIGQNLLPQLDGFIKDFGNNALLICDEFILNKVKAEALPALEKAGITAHAEQFQYECTDTEIGRIHEIVKHHGANVVVGIGGGKTMDVAKAVAHFAHIPVIIFPTIASTDAPCTALSVIYKDDGEFDRYLFLPQNPDAVIADTGIIAAAPTKFFAAGIGDALATFFEARSCCYADGLNLVQKRVSRTGLGMALMCYELIVENVEMAMDAARRHVVTPALEEMVEATIYLSGIGAESGGLAAAHAVSNGMSSLPQLHHIQHGEKVAFGLLTQLVLEKADAEEIENVIYVMKTAGLPLTLADFGIEEMVEADWRQVAEIACAEGDTMCNMTVKVNADRVYQAMVAADALAQRYHD